MTVRASRRRPGGRTRALVRRPLGLTIAVVLLGGCGTSIDPRSPATPGDHGAALAPFLRPEPARTARLVAKRWTRAHQHVRATHVPGDVPGARLAVTTPAAGGRVTLLLFDAAAQAARAQRTLPGRRTRPRYTAISGFCLYLGSGRLGRRRFGQLVDVAEARGASA